MTSGELEAYLHAHIPISHEMGVRVASAGLDSLRLAAPLSPNINHRATAFGGSVSALAILAGWAWLHVMMRAANVEARLVIQRNSIEYLAPIAGDFEARCGWQPRADVDRFLATFRRGGKARLALTVEILFQGDVAARFEGDYVALRSV